MVEVFVASDCGNAPKKLVLRDYAIAMAKHDKEAVLSALADDVEWEVVGQRTIRGKTDFAAALDSVGEQVVTLRLDTILTHGDEGSVSGSVEFTDARRLRCCDVYKFSGHSKTAKVKRITSYWIEA
jgi:limonene-1,2-epoxide hydrolase